uniref:Secreted protein n=1 Tax=Opuntia streptacantha TaxID=393608 RepID=A0A7C9ABG7_OPUST
MVMEWDHTAMTAMRWFRVTIVQLILEPMWRAWFGANCCPHQTSCTSGQGVKTHERTLLERTTKALDCVNLSYLLLHVQFCVNFVGWSKFVWYELSLLFFA